MSRSILAVARDTSELVALAGGTLLRLADAGESLFLAEVRPTAGERISAGEGIAEKLGGSWLGSIVADADADADADGRPLRDPVMDVIRRARPDLILVAPPTDGELLPLSETVFNAAYCSTIPNYSSPTGLEAASVRAPIVEFDAPSRADFEPDTHVDIGDWWERKVDLLDAFAPAGSALHELAAVSSRVRGIQVQVEFAEAFRAEKAWGRLRPSRHLP